MCSACIIFEKSEKHREIVFQRGVLTAPSLPHASCGGLLALIHFHCTAYKSLEWKLPWEVVVTQRSSLLKRLGSLDGTASRLLPLLCSPQAQRRWHQGRWKVWLWCLAWQVWQLSKLCKQNGQITVFFSNWNDFFAERLYTGRKHDPRRRSPFRQL